RAGRVHGEPCLAHAKRAPRTAATTPARSRSRPTVAVSAAAGALAWRPGCGPAASPAAAAAADERRIVPEDGLLERARIGPRIEAQLIREPPSRLLVGGQRVRLASGRVQRPHP